MDYNFYFAVIFIHRQYVIVEKFLDFKTDDTGSRLD